MATESKRSPVTSYDPVAGPRTNGASPVTGPWSALRYLRQVGATARNVAEVVRFGGLETGELASPFAVVAEQVNYRLRHYFDDDPPVGGRPVLLIPPLMLTAEVWDVSPGTSAVAKLRAEGIDPWVVDFGDPSREPGGLARTLTDHVLAVSDAVDRVAEATGRDVVLAGYSQGGMFAYQVTALRRGKHVDSVVTFGSPADTTAPLPIPLSPEMLARLATGLVDSGLLRKVALPSWAVRLGFNLLSPVKTVQGRVQFLLALHDRDALLPRERQRRFLESDGFTAYAGPAIAELLEQFVAHNRMLEGGFVIDDRLVTLADIEVPVLSVVGTTDAIGHPDGVRAIRRAAPRAEVYELALPVGHFGLVVGSRASKDTWPAVVDWVRWRDGRGELPSTIGPAELVESAAMRPGAAAAAVGQAVEFGLDATRFALGAARRLARVATGVVSEAPTLLPKLSRLGHLDASTRISLGLLLDEQVGKTPQDVLFLFGDRGYRQREVKHRVDSVVKGLISTGVRHGDRVGVLMDTRPSAFTTVAALSRVGATAVLLRPDGDLRREARLGGITWVVSDPEHADAVEQLDGARWAVLGGGANDREMRPDVIDMERIDPDAVELPGWYRPNPQRAGDVAFVLFVGEGATTRAVRITNRRWAMSALGTATAAALRPGDTVYSVAPYYHSSALLMSVGGAIAGGARFAVASATDADTFWAEVRRYGATHVSYTWTSLRQITNAEPNPNEHYHPIKMFLGSGMPSNLWRRVVQRFPTARVLEFYASAEGAAILANLTGNPIGSLGRSLPGTPEVRVAAFDQDAGGLELGPDGLVRECGFGEVGLLLARVDPADSMTGNPLRGVFEPDDAWQSTGDLFRRDEHGEMWLVDQVTSLVRTAHGIAVPATARRAMEAIPAVDIAVAYGVPEGDSQVLVTAVTLRPGTELTAAELDRACDALLPAHRPSYVQVVPSMPVTAWCRPLWSSLRKAGIPKPTRSRDVFRLGDDRQHYQPMA
ncbi:MAG: putative long chain acyl-CoA synthase [Pseudonocardiales bacterium]|nr:putative long chain acyl-CoA synthase [Pseudonocardiales bacterium]